MQTPVSETVIDTAPLRRGIEMFLAMSVKLLEGVPEARALAKVKRCTQQIARVTKDIHAAEL